MAKMSQTASEQIHYISFQPTRQPRALPHEYIRGLKTKASQPKASLQMSTTLATLGLSHSIRNIRHPLSNRHSKGTGALIRFI